ncbi:putative sodium-dependent multivitamin transporter isoform X1 [Uloborus diversus]|uniref:putative sodium-dependent multivitamin transporter isoform X1 n=2 Tax=Uloborus diversus TaxID=327109 RepID=UPI00240A4D13|nr:putative sodium-dependent multivitamin transporter isoform X1 [Uloborus diversus]XP_054710766.1 putative sodium-dependent multivitamin transporter isoform X1 [Uloborus diversus]
MATDQVLGVADWVILSLMLIISAGIGVFFHFFGNKQKTTDDFLLAGKNMSIFPVSFSLMATFMSAATVIGIPTDIYLFGTHVAFKIVGFCIGLVLTSYIFLPVYFQMQATTAYEYLERRFGRVARKLCSLTFVLHMVLYVPVALYAPSLALSAVTNVSTFMSVILIGAVCTFYCALGGMKAVLWTDAFQGILMFVGIFGSITIGCIDVGGIGKVFEIAQKGGRLVVPGWEFDPTARYTMWNMIISSIMAPMVTYGANQVQVQRLLTVRNVSRSRKALIISLPLWCSFYLLNCLSGIVIYAFFSNCDPMTSPEKPISAPDQLVPYFVMTTLHRYPGLAGLCICGIFSASLSTVSSSVNSLTAVTMQDLIRPFFINNKKFTERTSTLLSKIITLFYGTLGIVLAFSVSKFGNLVKVTFLLFGLLGGPVMAMFFLGMMTRRANEKGVIVGLLVSLALTSWISFGSPAPPERPKVLPVSLKSCNNLEASNSTLKMQYKSVVPDINTRNMDNNSMIFNINEDFSTTVAHEKKFSVHKISFMWIGPIGFLTCAVIAYLCSILFIAFGACTQEIPDELLSPVFKFFSRKISQPIEKQTNNNEMERNGLKLKEFNSNNNEMSSRL